MGMAASQARFLGLTARKTNVEYEGQQINQQRTTLSNTTANYYNQLLGMAVPVPPSVADYTKTVYTFQDGSLMNSITSMIARNNGEYLISYNSSWTDDFTPVSQMSHIVATMGDDAEGNKLYEDFVYGTAGGCYTYLNDTSHDKNQKTQINHLIHVVNHMLGKGSYTTTNGNSFNITQNDIYWTTPNPPYGGDAETMASIAERIKGKPAAQKLVDLLYNAKEAYKGTVSQATLDNLRNQLNAIVENDLQDALSANYMVGADTLRKLGQISEITYNADGSVMSDFGFTERSYYKNEAGYVPSESFTSNGKGGFSCYYEYDEAGNLIKQRIHNAAGTFTVREYDASGQAVRVTHYDADGNEIAG